MKNHKLCLCALAALLLLLLMAGSAMASSGTFGVIYGTDTLNLRAQGSSSSQWLGSCTRGTWVEINGSQNNFYYVRTPDGKTGYMSKNYIDQVIDESDFVWTALVTNSNGGAFLNFRAQPNYNAQVLGIFYNGVPLHVLSASNGWYCVQINGQTGYVRGEYVADWGRKNPGSSTVATIKTPNNTAMNLRSGPGMNYPVTRQFPGDSYVSVIAKGNGWWCVSIGGYWGFMSSDFLQEGLCAARDQAAQGGSGTANTAYAVVANPKSTGSKVLAKLYNGTRLWVNAQGSEWCQVTNQTNGMTGYVMTAYIQLHNLPSTPWRTVSHPSGSYVNLRSSANMSINNVLSRMPSGASVQVLIPGSEWTKVSYGGTTGYMLTYFLK